MQATGVQATSSVGRIVEVETRLILVPMDRGAVAWSNVFLDRDIEYVVVTIRTSEGHEGVGYCIGSPFAGSGGFIADAVDDLLAPILIDSEAVEIERLWEEMSFQTMLVGRGGAAFRAIAAVDIALWDLLARAVGRPLCDLFGRFRSRVPTYASGGYYYSSDLDTDIGKLEEEVSRHMDLGFKAVKLKIGRFSAADDRKRIVRVMETVGPDVLVAVDANNAWRDAATAVNYLRQIDDLGLWWIEEPVLPDQMSASARIAEKLMTPIATGEIETTKSACARLIELGAAQILQTDATVAGGVTEWRKIAALAAGHDVQLAPHWAADIHLPLAAATPNVMTVEYFHDHVGILNFEKLLAEGPILDQGELVVRESPGHGILFDPEALAHFEVSR